jgi:hypothetical protein
MAEPGYATIVLWHWPAGEILSHGAFTVEPWRDRDHPAAKHRFLAKVPVELLPYFLGGRCGAELLEGEE